MHEHIELDNTYDYKLLKKRPVFTDVKMQVWKTFIEFATGLFKALKYREKGTKCLFLGSFY